MADDRNGLVLSEENTLTAEEVRRAEVFAEKIELNNTAGVMQYGAAAQKKWKTRKEKSKHGHLVCESMLFYSRSCASAPRHRRRSKILAERWKGRLDEEHFVKMFKRG